VAEPRAPLKGRGTAANPEGRFETRRREAFDDGWLVEEAPAPAPQTTATAETARRIISRNDSPDVPFRQSINPYRGCEHGCIYCFARPSHGYLNLSPGLDFETRLFYKHNAAALLDAELRAPGYVCTPIHLGANTDPYQPLEREQRLTRHLLEVLAAFRHPVTLVTKGTALMLRDLDLLAAMAAARRAHVAISLTTLDESLKRTLEPRAAGAASRLRVIRELTAAGVPVTALVSPVIPFITDHELEALLEAASDAGAQRAGYALLRLPHEVAPLFRDWLATHHPLRAERVMHTMQAMRGGRDYDSDFSQRHRGTGPYAALLAQRFRLACQRLGLKQRADWDLDTRAFRPPPQPGDQLALL
jgi:DNA repair photolyase